MRGFPMILRLPRVPAGCVGGRMLVLYCLTDGCCLDIFYCDSSLFHVGHVVPWDCCSVMLCCLEVAGSATAQQQGMLRGC